MIETTKLIGLILVGLSFLSIIFIPLFGLEKTPSKYVKCYDKFGNEIIGQQCFKESSHELSQFGFWMLMIMMVMVFIGSLLINGVSRWTW